jgi:hypothetical protein
MPIFRFDPISESSNDRRWQTSKICEPFWIKAHTENEAREMASLILVSLAEIRPGKPVVYSPWLDPKFSDCVLDDPKTEVPDGIIVTVAGHTHS